MAFHFKKIAEPDVELQVRERARAMLDFCQKKLGLSGIRIEWVRKAEEAEFNIDALLVESEQNLKRLVNDHSEVKTSFGKRKEEFWGEARLGSLEKDKIRVRADIPEWRILQTIAHECQHVRDNLDDYSLLNDWEKHADSFALEAIREFKSLGIGG